MRTNPYSRLHQQACDWIRKAVSPKRKLMWYYPAKTITTDSWRLYDLAERVKAADQLGYRVELRWGEDGLIVEYVEKLPVTPYFY